MLAEFQEYDLSLLKTPEEQEAYKQGAAMGAQAVDAGMGDMEAPPEGYDGQQVTPEDIMEVIQYLLSEGKITPEEAEKIVGELAAADDGEGDPGVEGGDAGAGGPPMDDPNMPPEEKEAMPKIAKAEQSFNELVVDVTK